MLDDRDNISFLGGVFMLELAIIPVLTGAAALYLGMKNNDKDEKQYRRCLKLESRCV